MAETAIQTFDGNVGIGTNDPGSDKLKVTGGTTSLQGLSVTSSLTVGGVTNAHVPSGLIIMWSGVTIPTGWSLCDGNNSTPDLRDRFILSKGDSSSVGQTGGANNLSIDGSTLPQHTHTVSTSGNEGSHSHTINALASDATTHNHTLTASVDSSHTHVSNLSGGDHIHSVNTNQVSHQHNASTNNANSGHQHWQGLYIGQPNVVVDSKSTSYPGFRGLLLDNSYEQNMHNQQGQFLKDGSGAGLFRISEDKGHIHNASLVANDTSHTHTAPSSSSSTSSHSHNVTISQVSNHTHSIANNVDSVNHSHNVQHQSSGGHTHTSTTNSSGQGGTVVKMPVYYALAFIMKD